MEQTPELSTPPVAATRVVRAPGRLTSIWSVPATRALLALLLVLLIGCLFNANAAFFKLGTHRDALRQASVFGILACGLTLVILSGGIDLAVGSMLGLIAVMFSMMTMWWNWPAAIAIGACVLIGAVCGGVSGSLVAWARLQPFIATLAM